MAGLYSEARHAGHAQTSVLLLSSYENLGAPQAICASVSLYVKWGEYISVLRTTPAFWVALCASTAVSGHWRGCVRKWSWVKSGTVSEF